MLPVAATASTATAARANPDGELINLAEQIFDLNAESQAAEVEYSRCYETYKRIRPERSRKLIWQVGDVVGYLREDPQPFLWCDHDQIDDLRNRTFFGQWLFTGTTQEFEKLGLQNWRDSRVKPVADHDHLFVAHGGERGRKRAEELIEALDEYNAAEEAADESSGCRRRRFELRARYSKSCRVPVFKS